MECGSPDFGAQWRNGACPALAGESEGSLAGKVQRSKFGRQRTKLQKTQDFANEVKQS